MSRRQVRLAQKEMEEAAGTLQVPEPKTLAGRGVDYLVKHPFKIFFGLSIPTVGVILAHNMRHTHLKFSHRLVHTRVQGQAACLVILGTTMLLNQVCSKMQGKLARGREENRGYGGYDAAAGHATWRTDAWKAKQKQKKEEQGRKRAEMTARNQAAVRGARGPQRSSSDKSPVAQI